MKQDINYYELYLFRKIKLKNIPLSKLNMDILRLGAVNEPNAYVDVVLRLYRLYNSIDLIKFASLLKPDSFECYFMYDQIFMINPEKYFDLIPDKYKNGKMWNIMLEINHDKYFDLIPQQYRTREVVYEMIEKDPIKYFNEIQGNFYDSQKNRPVYIPIDEQAKLNKILFDVNPEKFWDYLIDKGLFLTLTASMCNKVMMIDAVKYFDEIPNKFVTSEMCKKIYKDAPEKLFRVIGFHSVDNIEWDSLLTLDMCLTLIKINSKRFFKDANASYIRKVFDFAPKSYFRRIPYDKRDAYICEKMYEIDAEKYFPLIPVSYITSKMCNEMFEKDPEKYFEMFPMKFRSADKCERMFKIDPEKYFLLFPNYNMTLEMCEKMFEIDAEKYFKYFPDGFKTFKMCQKMADLDIEKYIEFIPKRERTREMNIKLFNINPEKYFNDIPNEERTAEMWHKMFDINPREIFEIMPSVYKTQEMCIKYFELNPDYFDNYVPIKLLTKEMLIVLLKKDFERYIGLVRDEMIDVDMISIAKLEMDKIRLEGRMIYKENMTKLFSMVIKLYPEYGNLIYMTLDDKIKDALYLLLVDGGTIELIADKFNVSISFVNGILEKIKEEDLTSYMAIRDILEVNQRSYFINMMKDVKNLVLIINSIGNIDRQGISAQQKLKFAYLCNKYLHNSLEEIYNFNYSKYTNEDTSVITKFFNRVLKYNYIYNKDVIIPERKTIQFNNGWLRKYNRDKFFAIKNGIPTMERRYGKNSELLTLEIEEKILNVLKLERMPLNEVIVMTAFKEYFNGNLALYIEKLKGYDAEFELARKSFVSKNNK